MKFLIGIACALCLLTGIAWALLMKPAFGILTFFMMSVVFVCTIFSDETIDNRKEI